jgi:hypothetical protein
VFNLLWLNTHDNQGNDTGTQHPSTVGSHSMAPLLARTVGVNLLAGLSG